MISQYSLQKQNGGAVLKENYPIWHLFLEVKWKVTSQDPEVKKY